MDKKKSNAGRPREHDREQIAIDIVNWAKKDDSLNLCAFCCTREPPIAPSKITEWSREDDQFRLAYETAKAFLGARREDRLNKGTLHVKAYDLNANTYDHFLKIERRQQAEFESSLKEKELSHISENDNQRFDSMMEQIKGLQSDRNMASNNISAAQ